VAVGYQDGAEPRAIIAQVGEVRDGEVDSGQVLFQEKDSGVDDDNVVTILDGHHVLADFAESA
jgi:hypothetical protein